MPQVKALADIFRGSSPGPWPPLTVATQIGSYMYRYLLTVLKQKDLSGSVKVTNIYTTNAVASVEESGIAAYAAPAGQVTAALSKAGYTVNIRSWEIPNP